MPQGGVKKVYVIAGEASGDLHGANLIQALKERSPSPLEIHGIGGDKIRATGALSFMDIAHFHVTGITDAVKMLPRYKKAERAILAGIRLAKPNLVVLIDNPGFNLHLAKKIHAMGVPMAYYISPQLWAWKENRIHKMKKFMKKVLVVFGFETAIYEKHGVPVKWVGHPLKDLIVEKAAAAPPISKKNTLIALMPGSRAGELERLLPVFLKAADLLRAAMPGAEFALIKAPTLSQDFYRRFLGAARPGIRLVEQNAYGVLKSSDVVLVCSGTATLECALLGVPMVIAYRGSFLTYLVAKAVIRVKWLGLPNLVLGEGKFPELLQNDATPEKLAAEALSILNDPARSASMRKDLSRVSEMLGEPGAASRAADEILKLLN